jgi:hypothetical protein
MANPGISLSRLPYDDSAWRILLRSSNGDFGGVLEFYIDPSGLRDFARHLTEFPFGQMNEVRLEIGSRNGNWAHYLLLRAFEFDRAGHSALQVVVDNRGEGERHDQASFFTPSEAAAMNQLGREILAWLENSDQPLHWHAIG